MRHWKRACAIGGVIWIAGSCGCKCTETNPKTEQSQPAATPAQPAEETKAENDIPQNPKGTIHETVRHDKLPARPAKPPTEPVVPGAEWDKPSEDEARKNELNKALEEATREIDEGLRELDKAIREHAIDDLDDKVDKLEKQLDQEFDKLEQELNQELKELEGQLEFEFKKIEKDLGDLQM